MAVAALLSLAACKTGSGDPQQGRGFRGTDSQVQSYVVMSQVPKCDSSRFAQVYYVSSEQRFYYCDGVRLQRLTAVGSPGADGTSWLVALSLATAEQCPSGGSVIHVGPDNDRDRALDADEIAASQAICNGVDGEDGVDGQDGTDGRDGSDGQDGQTTLVSTELAPEGACPNGGIAVFAGIDTSDDGVLDPDEVMSTSYVCNGADGSADAGAGGGGGSGGSTAGAGGVAGAGSGGNAGSGGAVTTLTGTVFAPNGVDPVYGALVYVPSGPVPAFVDGGGSGRCTSTGPGNPIAQATTDTTGHFSLSGPIAGPSVPVVIQIGRWRRQITLPNVAAGASVTVSPALTRLPRIRAEGDIPRIAAVTGLADSVECIFRKMGVADSEFSAPNGPGRIHVWAGPDNPGAAYPGAINGGVVVTPASVLFSSVALMNGYDAIVLGCQGIQTQKTTAAKENLMIYTNAGGRVLADHLEAMSWMADPSPFAPIATWGTMSPPPDPSDVRIDQSFSRGAALAQWLGGDPASPLTSVSMNGLKRDIVSLNLPVRTWLYASAVADAPVHFTFETPFGAAPENRLGRVLVRDYHSTPATSSLVFPEECSSGPMTPEEKILEFAMFDLGRCIED